MAIVLMQTAHMHFFGVLVKSVYRLKYYGVVWISNGEKENSHGLFIPRYKLTGFRFTVFIINSTLSLTFYIHRVDWKTPRVYMV